MNFIRNITAFCKPYKPLRYFTRFVTIPVEEYELLQVAAWQRGQRAEAQKKLKTLTANKINQNL